MFDHGPLPKEWRTSIEGLQNQTVRRIIEVALFQAPEEIEENPPSVSIPTIFVYQRLVYQQPPAISKFVKLMVSFITLLK